MILKRWWTCTGALKKSDSNLLGWHRIDIIYLTSLCAVWNSSCLWGFEWKVYTWISCPFAVELGIFRWCGILDSDIAGNIKWQVLISPAYQLNHKTHNTHKQTNSTLASYRIQKKQRCFLHNILRLLGKSHWGTGDRQEKCSSKQEGQCPDSTALACCYWLFWTENRGPERHL